MSTPIETNTEELQEILQTVYNLPMAGGGSSKADFVITGMPDTGSGDYFNWNNGSYAGRLFGVDYVTFDPEKVFSAYEKLASGEEVRAVLMLPTILLNSWNGYFSAVFSAIRVAANNNSDEPFLIVRFDCASVFSTAVGMYQTLEYIFVIDTANRAATFAECRQWSR